MHPTADQVLDGAAAEIRELARSVYATLLAAFPDAVVTADADGIGLGTTTGYKGLIFTVLPASRHVTIGFARGATLPDPAGLLEGTGKVHRHVKIRSEADLRRAELADLVTAALARAGQ